MICREIMKRLQQECTEKTDHIIDLEKQLKFTQAQYIKVIEQNKSLQQNLQAKEQECEKLKERLKDCQQNALNRYINNNIQCVLPSNCMFVSRYKQALENIEEIAKQGLKPICYKSNCNRCQCYDGDDSKIAITNLINEYFTEDGFVDDDRDFYEALEGLVENERASCNKAKPISERILTIINEVKDAD